MRRLLLQLIIAAALVGGGIFGWLALTGERAADGRSNARSGGGQAAVVVVQPARLGPVVERVEAVGTTRARESVDVVAEVAGRVAAIGFQEGETVAAGQLLVELDTAGERASLREAQAQRSEVVKQLDRARQLLATNNVPQARVDELVSAAEAAAARIAGIEVRLRDREIRAPFDGIVGLREISAGAYVSPQQRITTLDDIGVLHLEFAVQERFLGQLRPQMPVLARSPAFADGTFAGRVALIDTRVDPTTRSVRVRAEIPNEERLLRPGMFMSVELILAEREAVLVPEEAVVSEGAAHHVFVVAEDRAARRLVQLGVRTRGEVEIRDGVADGEPVVVLGLQRVRDGAPVRIRDAAGS